MTKPYGKEQINFAEAALGWEPNINQDEEFVYNKFPRR